MEQDWSSEIMDMKELSSILQQNGIVGAGGAGFPTYAKLDQRAETIILNCAECEPLLRYIDSYWKNMRVRLWIHFTW